MKSNHKTFTLIELILVVAIVAILAGVMIPAITSARQKARAARLLQLVDILRDACIMYKNDTGQNALEAVTGHLSGDGVMPSGWDGPYIQKPLRDEEIFPGILMWIFPFIACDFDFDGDGTIEKSIPTTGNTLLLYNSPESIAKIINDQTDMNVSGDWKVTGRVRYFDGARIIAIYLIGGS